MTYHTPAYTGRALDKAFPPFEERWLKPKKATPVRSRKPKPIKRDWLLVASSALVAQRVTISEIQAAVCNHYGVRLADLVGPSRLGSIIVPRFVSMWICKKLTARSDAYIAKVHKRKDHTITVNAMEKMRRMIARSEDFAREVEALKTSLEARCNGH